jgi:hypothetical protein
VHHSAIVQEDENHVYVVACGDSIDIGDRDGNAAYQMCVITAVEDVEAEGLVTRVIARVIHALKRFCCWKRGCSRPTK